MTDDRFTRDDRRTVLLDVHEQLVLANRFVVKADAANDNGDSFISIAAATQHILAAAYALKQLQKIMLAEVTTAHALNGVRAERDIAER